MSRTGCRRALLAVTALALSIVVSGPAAAHPAPLQPAPVAERFQKVPLTGTEPARPTRIAVAPDGRVVYAGRDGQVAVWHPDTRTSTVAGVLPAPITGLALAPDFTTSGHLYLHVAPPDQTPGTRVSRFTLTPDGVLDVASETPVADLRQQTGTPGWHSVGDLLAAPDGRLFVADGDRILRVTPGARPEVFVTGLPTAFTLGGWDPAAGTLWLAEHRPAGQVRALLVHGPGVQARRPTGLLSAVDSRTLLDLEFGPNGSLYVLESGIYRIDPVAGNRAPPVTTESSVDSGPLPLTVDVTAAATTDPDGDPLAYTWDFTGDGVPDRTGPSATWTYEAAGRHTPTVTVTDPAGAVSVGTLTVVAGNTRPALTIESPADGGWAEFGQDLPFRVRATDPEDGPVDCTKILVTYQVGHDRHGHPSGEARPGPDCTGVLSTPAAAGPGADGYVFHALGASYTDGGGVPGAPPLTGSAGIVLHPREYRARDHQDGVGVVARSGQLFVPDRGDWFSFPRVNLAGIDHLSMEFATRRPGAALTVHADSPAGPVVATFPGVPATGPAERVHRWLAADVTDPGGVHDLYFVADWPAGARPELSIRSFRFQTTPTVAVTRTPARPDGRNGWYTTDVALTVAPVPYWDRQYSTDGGVTWAPATGPVPLTADGTHRVHVRAVDPAGRVSAPSTVTVPIDRTAPTVLPAGRHPHAVPLVLGPLARDGLSGLASATATLGGVPVDPAAPVELWRFPAGTHRLAVTATDNAGNTATTAVPLEITTSLTELTPLVGRFRLNWFAEVVLTLQLEAAEDARADGRAEEFVEWVRAFRSSLSLVGDAAARTILRGDATAVLAQAARGHAAGARSAVAGR